MVEEVGGERREPTLNDTVYFYGGISETNIKRTIDAALLERLLRHLLSAGIITKENLAVMVDEAEAVAADQVAAVRAVNNVEAEFLEGAAKIMERATQEKVRHLREKLLAD